jgi:hypothetical protein
MEELMSAILYVVGLVGMAGVWLVPSQTVSTIFRCKNSAGKARKPAFVLALIFLTAATISLYVAWQTMPRVFQCLGESRCSASKAGGLLNLAAFGVSVILVEAIWLVDRAVSKRLWLR